MELIIETHLPISINPTRILRLGIDDVGFGFLDLDNLSQTSLEIEIGVEIKCLILQPRNFRWTQFLTNGNLDRKSVAGFGFPDLNNLFQTTIRILIGVEIKSLTLQPRNFQWT